MLKKIAFVLVLLALPAALLMHTPPAKAFDFFGDTCKDQSAQNSPTCPQAKSESGPGTNRITGTHNIINVAADVLALAAGVAAVIMIIISGLTFVTAGGNQEAATNSRRRIVGAVVGLVVIVLAWTFIRFITDRFIQ